MITVRKAEKLLDISQIFEIINLKLEKFYFQQLLIYTKSAEPFFLVLLNLSGFFLTNLIL